MLPALDEKSKACRASLKMGQHVSHRNILPFSYFSLRSKPENMRALFPSLLFTALLMGSTTTVCIAQKSKEAREDERDVATISKVYAKYALDAQPSITADTDLIGIWKMKEDEDSHNYFVLERENQNGYVFTYMNHEGANRTFENDPAFFSKIGNTEFINVGYSNWWNEDHGFFFLKVIERTPNGFEMTLALVADTTLKDLPDRAAVRARIKEHLNDPHYFKKPVHFRKILPLMYCK
ncbi:MAG: hypothetical protein BGO69_12375 [Bacteroidetes bacterium 46-16]|nr:MAG: hypothetical protein BGO69_12375 [Bacteroidetes bacterium 46-16]